MVTCQYCGLEFEKFQQKSNHIRWNHLNINRQAFKEKMSKSSLDKYEKIYGVWVEEEVKCSNIKCINKTIARYKSNGSKTSGKKENYYCSVECSHYSQPTISKETREKISEKIKDAWNRGVYNDSSFNSHNNNYYFTSKGERKMLSDLKEFLPDYDWTSGGRIFLGKMQFSRDAYSNKHKICVEYDGVWHFKDIKGQLLEKQKKDKGLEQWCVENNYRLVRIEEGHYNFEILKEAILSNEQIIKIGKSY